MKMIVGFFAFAATALMAAPALAQHEPVLQPVAFDTLYVPNGFDSNDNVQIVGAGMFKNACYRPATTSFKIDEASHTITISPSAYQYSGFCLQVVLPFDRVIDVGILKPGQWTVKQEGTPAQMTRNLDAAPTDVTLGAFRVAPATRDEVDDYLYAPVSQAYLHQAGPGSDVEVVLNGSFPSDCMQFNELKVDVQDSKVLVVQPIVTMQSRPDCHAGPVPFTKVVKLQNVAKGRYLLHVRSMNGKAINNLVDVQ